jgi:hypothetical protein
MGGGENGFEGREERLLGLLDTGLEEIGGLEENRGCETGAETGGEVEYCFGCYRAELARVAVLCRCQALHVEVPAFTGTANAPLFDMAASARSTRDCGCPGS